MDFMSILGRLLLLPIYAGMFFTALFSQAGDKAIVMSLCVLIGKLPSQQRKRLRSRKRPFNSSSFSYNIHLAR